MRTTWVEEFACPPEKLWPLLEEPEQQKKWMKGLLANDLTSPPPARPGSTFRMRIREGRKVGEYLGEITAHDPPRHLGIRFWGGGFAVGMVMRCDYRLADLGNGRTRLDYVAELEPGPVPWWLKLLAPLIRLFSRVQLRGFMKTLKRLAEGPGGPG